MLQDRTMARLASDVRHYLVAVRSILTRLQLLKGLDYLQKHNIAHRDIRSDNLLLNKAGVLKISTHIPNPSSIASTLTCFCSRFRQCCPSDPSESRQDRHGRCSILAGQCFCSFHDLAELIPISVISQAPEIRDGPYNALKVDVWSVGATVWEMAETQPPFSDTNIFADRWPKVKRPELHSPAFHEFLHLCSEPAATRPGPSDLLEVSSSVVSLVDPSLKMPCRVLSFTVLVDDLSSSISCLDALRSRHHSLNFSLYFGP